MQKVSSVTNHRRKCPANCECYNVSSNPPRHALSHDNVQSVPPMPGHLTAWIQDFKLNWGKNKNFALSPSCQCLGFVFPLQKKCQSCLANFMHNISDFSVTQEKLRMFEVHSLNIKQSECLNMTQQTLLWSCSKLSRILVLTCIFPCYIACIKKKLLHMFWNMNPNLQTFT